MKNNFCVVPDVPQACRSMTSQKCCKISNDFLHFHEKKELQKKSSLGTVVETQEGLQETLDKKRGLPILIQLSSSLGKKCSSLSVI